MVVTEPDDWTPERKPDPESDWTIGVFGKKIDVLIYSTWFRWAEEIISGELGSSYYGREIYFKGIIDTFLRTTGSTSLNRMAKSQREDLLLDFVAEVDEDYEIDRAQRREKALDKQNEIDSYRSITNPVSLVYEDEKQLDDSLAVFENGVDQAMEAAMEAAEYNEDRKFDENDKSWVEEGEDPWPYPSPGLDYEPEEDGLLSKSAGQVSTSQYARENPAMIFPPCPANCGGNIYAAKSSYGTGFYSRCSTRGCQTKPTPNAPRALVFASMLPGTTPCPRCRGPLIVKQGRRGDFVGCNSFPLCDYTSNAMGMATRPYEPLPRPPGRNRSPIIVTVEKNPDYLEPFSPRKELKVIKSPKKNYTRKKPKPFRPKFGEIGERKLDL